MNLDLWEFLSIAVVFSACIAILGMVIFHRGSMKRMELKALQLQNDNLNAENKDAAIADLQGRVAPLEAVVTEKRHSLSDEIKSL